LRGNEFVMAPKFKSPPSGAGFLPPFFGGGSVGALGKMCTLYGIEIGTLGRNPPLTQTWGWTLPTSGCLSGGFLCPTGYETGRWRPASRRMHAREFVTLKGRIATGLSQVGFTLDLEAHGGHRKAKGALGLVGSWFGPGHGSGQGGPGPTQSRSDTSALPPGFQSPFSHPVYSPTCSPVRVRELRSLWRRYQ
jgi:hypothetical protein